MQTVNTLLALATVYAVFSIFVELYSAYIYYKEHKQLKISKKVYLYFLIVVSSALVDYFVTNSFELFTKGVLGGLGFTAFLAILMLIITVVSKLLFKFRINQKLFIVGNEHGFFIHKGKKTTEYRWTSFDDAFFNEKKNAITFSGREKVVVKKSVVNWELFVSNLPKNFRSLDYNFIDSIFANLLTCRMCGMNAYNGEECYYCGTEKWSEELENEYGTDENHIRELQLDFFATMEPSEKFSEFKIKDNFFKQDPNWKPLVTKEEVLEYSKKEYWE